ncbi:MAG: YeeE/YedE family protein [Alphaproteobacteria bacterium]
MLSLNPSFTPYLSLLGGVLIGLGAFLLYWGIGRIAGISGVVGNFFEAPLSQDNRWRLFFILGLILSYIPYRLITGEVMIIQPNTWPLMLIGAFIMGLGAAIGNGCTSGHGICGLGQLSFRSLVAVMVFMTAGVLAASFIH